MRTLIVWLWKKSSQTRGPERSDQLDAQGWEDDDEAGRFDDEDEEEEEEDWECFEYIVGGK